MTKTIHIQQEDFLQICYLIEKLHYITHRALGREDADNAAYSLAISFAEQNAEQQLNELRSKLWTYLSEKEHLTLEEMVDDIDYQLPYNDSLEDLRAKLQPFLPKFIPFSDNLDEK